MNLLNKSAYEWGKMRAEWLAEDFPNEPTHKLFSFLMRYHKEEFTQTPEYKEGIKAGLNARKQTKN